MTISRDSIAIRPKSHGGALPVWSGREAVPEWRIMPMVGGRWWVALALAAVSTLRTLERSALPTTRHPPTRPVGLEPTTPRSEVWCSVQLSYGRRLTA
jgi:hypothetical protein